MDFTECFIFEIIPSSFDWLSVVTWIQSVMLVHEDGKDTEIEAVWNVGDSRRGVLGVVPGDTSGVCFTKQFTNTVKHATHKTNRHINRATHNIQGYNITLTTSQVHEAIKQSKNNNSQGPDKLNIRHLKHIGPLGLAFLTSMFKTALNKNIIPHTWKLANIVPIPKPNKDTDKGTSYRPISLFSVIA